PRPARKAKSSHCSPVMNPSKAIGGAPTPTSRRCAAAGTSPATPAMSTPTALSSSPAGATTRSSPGEDRAPVEIESCPSLHPAVWEVAVVGLADERWGKIVWAFVKRRAAVAAEDLDQFCRTSGLANFKRPRRYVFVEAIPKSPVGKLLRRKLVAGEY